MNVEIKNYPLTYENILLLNKIKTEIKNYPQLDAVNLTVDGVNDFLHMYTNIIVSGVSINISLNTTNFNEGVSILEKECRDVYDVISC
ncbi:hypothetical protein L0B53_18550 (plasmid) [Vibrio sp. SS-MA-C1-2]|uniref:hypothetical protein n=1 Tax=Vibrio sp. SS-MA-C1-2 TaxID=2908646 RepID=UPI001F190132|nr:hypothetical protein [Vibrio sp. SS-MA-C1-2]UJF20324.1 hypothetical protein L0B53_18550 [Vibrio sp. SS-MA-C1-2]